MKDLLKPLLPQEVEQQVKTAFAFSSVATTGIGLLILVVGALMVAKPEYFWRLSRWRSKGDGLTTMAAPDDSALSSQRFRGFFIIFLAIVWLVFANMIFTI